MSIFKLKIFVISGHLYQPFLFVLQNGTFELNKKSLSKFLFSKLYKCILYNNSCIFRAKRKRIPMCVTNNLFFITFIWQVSIAGVF